jgi:hypothetical protein
MLREITGVENEWMMEKKDRLERESRFPFSHQRSKMCRENKSSNNVKGY